MLTVVVFAALLQNAAINGQRDAYIACLKQSSEAAKAQNITGDAFEAHARQSCAAAEQSFKNSLIQFDVRNKIPRKQAAADAQLQADDFLSSSVSKYKAQLAK